MRWLLNILFHGDLPLAELLFFISSSFSSERTFIHSSRFLTMYLFFYADSWRFFFVWVGPDSVLAGKGEEWERWY